MRVNVYVPEDLGEQVKALKINVSAVVQKALRALLDCSHDELECARCGQVVEPATMVGEALSSFYRDLLNEWQTLVDRGGTAVGAAQVAKRVAIEHEVPDAEHAPVPRPPRSLTAV